MDTEQVTYSSKSTAARGAKRLKVVNPNFDQLDNGRWVVTSGKITNEAKPLVHPDRPVKKNLSRKQRAKADRAAAEAEAVEELRTEAEDNTSDEPTNAEIVEESERLNREFDPVATGAALKETIGAALVDRIMDKHDDLPAGTYTLMDVQYDGAKVTGTVEAPDGSTHTVTYKDPALADFIAKDSGGFSFGTTVPELPTAPPPLPTLPGGIDLNNPELITPKRASVAETYDELEALAPVKSTVVSPVAFIWAFLDLNPAMPRKEAVAIFVKNGINIHTARTQFQAYRAAGGVRKK